MTQAISQQTRPLKRIGAFEKRVHEIDFIRGFLMILVLLDHFILSLGESANDWYRITNVAFCLQLSEACSFYWDSVARSLIRPMVLFGFTFISGISCAFSKDNWKRAGLMVLVYMGVSIVTNIMQATMGSGFRIDFNVIGVLAFSTLIYCFFQKKSWRTLSALVLLFSFITLFIIPMLMTIPNITKAFVPVLWTPGFIRSSWDPATLSFVFHDFPSEAASATMGLSIGDHMPLFPYIVFFFLGALISKFVYKERKSLIKNRYDFERPVCFVGRHALWFYLGHQVVIFPLFQLITFIIRN